MKNINIIIDAVVNENNINSLGHRLKKSFHTSFIIRLKRNPMGA